MTTFINKKHQLHILISCFLAGCLEIYDFTIFGFLSSALHKNYFSFLDSKTSLVITYTLFAIGFVFRPLGSILFGHIGDKYGRKTALVVSVSMMGTASLGMFLLPTYEMIGLASCLIIVLIRIVQGISVGGEYSGAIIYAVEHFDKRKSGAVGSLVITGCLSGILLATLVSSFVQKPYMPEYAWRFAFLLGFVLSMVGYFIRNKLTETPEFQSLSRSAALRRGNLFDGIKRHRIEFIATIFMAATNGVNVYFMTVFLPGYLKSRHGVDLSYLATISTAIMASLAPIFGYLSDSFGRPRQAALGAAAMGLFALVMLPTLYHSANTTVAVTMIAIQAFLASTQAGATNTLVVEIFPPEYRFRCSALGYSIGMGVIGGTSPMIASLITNHVGENPMYLAAFVATISLLGSFTLLRVMKKQRDI